MTNPPRQASTLFLLSLCVWTAACTSDASSNDAGFSERDSSGIRILETTLLGPRVNSREVLRIGVLEGPTELTFNRISDVRVGTDGRLYVLDGGDKLIKVFDRSGSPLYTLGGEGEGPSEFQAPGPFTLAGDSLFVFDWRLGRITIFDHAGVLLTTIRVDYRTFTHGFPVALARAPNAGFLIVGTTGGCALPRRPNDNQWRLYSLGSDGAIADTLLKDEIRNWIPVYIEARNLCTVIPWPFGSSPSMAFDQRGHAFLSTGSAFEIRALDTSLQTTSTIFRYSVTHRPVTPDEREHLRERVFERERIDAFMRRHLEEVIDSVGFPPTWPGIAELKIDALGRIWASRAAAPEADEREWDVLDNGRHSMTVVLPGNFRVTDVTSDRIVGVLTDDLDVQYIAIFAVPDVPPRT